ncbi:MAG: GH32 C-terminal domain-containing protein [Verrucomicrobiae bacterium]|nr:GH32 C-terminal domain-containing protein [Verrucomicrobiae bacterium]
MKLHPALLLLGITLTAIARDKQPDYTSRVPKFTFAGTLEEQEAQLKTNPLMLRFAESRRKLASDPHRPLYHFVSPEGGMNDPNGLCFWQGRWHLFYQGYPPEDPRQHWGHAVSDDLVHWRDLPYAIYPNPEEKCYSGATLVEKDRVIAMYHGTKAGNMVAIARDPLLLNWEKVAGRAVIPIASPDGSPLPYRVFDPCIWKKDGFYYSLSGGTQPGPGGKNVAADFLFRSKDLVKWDYLHPFVEGDRFTLVGDDGACPYFWPIGNRHMLLFFSHMSGGQYLLGDCDKQRDKLVVTAHGKFNHGAVSPAGVHAPSATPDGKGGLIVIFNMNPAKKTPGWNQIMTLARRLALVEKEELDIEPAGNIESLRGGHQRVEMLKLPPNKEVVLQNIRGSAMEIAAEIDVKGAPMVELNVLRSPDRQEFTRIALFKERGYRTRWESPARQLSVVSLDTSCSSSLEDARSRPPENAQVFIGEKEPFKLRVFVDRSVVEVFVNGRQCLAARVYPGRADSLGVSLRAQGREALLKSLDAWQMKSIYPCAPPTAETSGDIVLGDFEGNDYGEWVAAGPAFGAGPARGTLPRQMRGEGFQGKGLVNSFHGSDKPTGTLTSPEFKIERRYISFLIGGGGWEGKTCMNLLVDGKVVRTATGPNVKPGGSEALAPASWDMGEFLGKTARIQIVDDATGGWGHINVDHIVLTDRKPPALLSDQKRVFKIEKRYLNIPIKNGAPKRKVSVLADGKPEVTLDIELADADPDWWAFMDTSAWRGQAIALMVDKLPEDSTALKRIEPSDEIKGAENLYREPLRPQFHFSSKRGWNNDPNGLVFYRGEYHLFYQHNPYGTKWGNMHWGHAVSRELVHWQELGDALAPDAMGPMFSGSAVVDWRNTSGLGKNGQPPQILIYTAAGKPTVQCLASSTDGRNFTKFSGNPVVKEITPGNRDPKVFWHEPAQKWVMALYVGLPEKKHAIHFLGSPNLKDWAVLSQTGGFYECPDFFELAVDGDAGKKKWVLTAASSDYMVGSFDGAKFTPETEKLKGHRGRGFYAAQTFSDEPKHRRIQIGWLQAPSPGMPFNQCMSLPLELKLISATEGPRLTWTPVKELEKLRAKSHRIGARTLKEGDSNPFAAINSELLEIRAEFEPAADSMVTFNIRGVEIAYDAAKQEIVVNNHRASAPLRDGRQRLTIYADRTAFEVFASDGLTYVPMPVIPKAEDTSLALTVKGDAARFASLEAHELRSAWEK